MEALAGMWQHTVYLVVVMYSIKKYYVSVERSSLSFMVYFSQIAEK